MLLLWVLNLIIPIKSKLLFVFSHFRHGARGPWENVNISSGIDILDEKWNGIGELTGAGMRMHYLEGYYMKNKYKDFINLNKYNKDEFIILSTLMNRTILSAYSQLIGMFPPGSGYKLNENQIKFAKINYGNYSEDVITKINELKDFSIEKGLTIFPINVINPKDRLMRLDKGNVCPYSEYIKKTNKKKGKYNNTMNLFIKDFNDIYGNYFKQAFNIKDDFYKDFTNIYNLADAFISSYFDGRDMIKLKNKTLNDNFYKFALNVSFFHTFNHSFRGDDSDILSIISMSPIFEKILYWMNKRIELHKNNKSDIIEENSPKMVFLSAHDSTLAAQSIFFNKLFNIKYDETTFAANFQLELNYNETSKNYYINYITNGKLNYTFDYNNFNNTITKNIKNKNEVNDFCDTKIGFNFWFIYFIIALILVIVMIILVILIPHKIKEEEDDNQYEQI